MECMIRDEQDRIIVRLVQERDQLQSRVAELELALRYIDEQSLDARVIAKARAALEGKG